LLGSKWTEELVLLFDGLVFTVTDLGRGIDEFDLDVLGGESLGLGKETLSKGDFSLSWSHNLSSQQKEIFIHNTVVRESTEWGDVLDMGISLSRSIVVDTSDST
jgi:hypothetical protein